MTRRDEAWDNLWRIFHDACEIEGEERATFLKTACDGDQALYDQVCALLAALKNDPGFLETPPALPGFDVDDAHAMVGEKIGAYEIRRLVGGGGMGVVYEALQTEPIERTVAVKLIKRGMDSREVISRFLAERQALALMGHPNIAQVYDAGVAENGGPYFAMEFVEGEPVDQYCDDNALSINERVDIFTSLCDAVQHAHRKGVIHRDLKPSNVLVTIQAGRPAVKIVDFGIAKAVHGALSRRAFETGAGRVLGTPEFMSPEQAKTGGVDIDTRTDVYSLGVILYMLLVGAPPYDAATLAAATDRPEARPPSRSYGEAAGDTRLIAERRRLTPEALTRAVRGDLDWIVVKALETDRARRYESAAALAADLRRYRSGRAVEAGPPSRIYRFRKFAGRNRIALSFASVLGATIVVGGVVASLGWVRALAAEREAVSQAERAEATNAFLTELLEGAGPSAAQGRDKQILLDMAEAAAVRLENGGDIHPEVELDVRRALGRLYLQLAQYDEAKANLDRAYEIASVRLDEHDPRRAELLALLGSRAMESGDLDDAQIKLLAAVGAYEAHFAETGEAPSQYEYYIRSLTALVITFGRLEDYARAEAYGRKAVKASGERRDEVLVDAYSNLARVLSFEEKIEEARGFHESALELARGDAVSEYTLANTLGHYGSFLNRFDQYEEAERMLRDSLARFEALTGPVHDRVARALTTLALSLRNQGRFDEARPLYLRALAIQQELLPADHVDIAKTYYNMGSDDARQGLYASAAENIRKSLEINRRHYPQTHSYIIEDTARVGELMLASGDAKGAAAWLGDLLSAQSGAPPRHWRLAAAQGHYGEALVALGRLEAAEESLKRGLAELDAYDAEHQAAIAAALYSGFARLETARGRPDDAAAWAAKKAALGKK